jgi:Trypsin-co-occurring domain 2
MLCVRSIGRQECGGESAMADSELGLAEAIDVVRSELHKAQDSGRGADVRFSVGSVQVELVVDLVKTVGGEASVKVLNLLSIGGKGEVSKGETSRVTVVLNPIGIAGAPFEVASAQDRRPDAPAGSSRSADEPGRSAYPGITEPGGGRPGG